MGDAVRNGPDVTAPDPEASKRITIAFVICTKDREADLRRCIDTIATQTRMPEQLVIVDSGSDGAEAVVRAFEAAHPEVRVDYLRSEPSLTRQRNIGIDRVHCDVIAFIDDDVLLEPAYLAEIERAFRAPGNEAIVGVDPYQGLPRNATRFSSLMRRVFMLVRTDADGRMQPSGHGTMTWQAPIEEMHDVEVGSGMTAYRRSLFDQIRFDEHFESYGYMEDQEFSYRASRLGRLVANPRARLFHNLSPSARIDRRRLAEMQVLNHYYVFRKHLPRDAWHWACFWWSELGELFYRLGHTARLRNTSILRGIAAGYVKILTGRAAADFGLDAKR